MKWPSRRRSTGSLSSSMRAMRCSTRLRMCSASPTSLSGSACCARPGTSSRLARVPNANTTCSKPIATAGPPVSSPRPPPREIDPHTRPSRSACGDHLPDRRDDMLGEHRGADDLGQHRVEGGVALLADQHDARVAGSRPSSAHASVVPANPPPTRPRCSSPRSSRASPQADTEALRPARPSDPSEECK